MLTKIKKFLVGLPLGPIIRVQNKDAYQTANEEYWALRVRFSSGKSVDMLLTEQEINRLIERADKNTEDIPRGVLR